LGGSCDCLRRRQNDGIGSSDEILDRRGTRHPAGNGDKQSTVSNDHWKKFSHGTPLLSLLYTPVVFVPLDGARLNLGTSNFALDLLMILKRMYTLLVNELDRHKIDRAA
jgi:hypothetical protein